MSIDISRQRFNPLKDFSGVLMQQGRVQLDSDWNDFVEILDRRSRVGTADIIGRCVVPRETPDGFKITVSSAGLSIGPGRIYVDGLLAENHGEAPSVFDPMLGELRGSNPVLYTKQPYLPVPAMLPTTGTHLVYVDVWEREVTFIEEPDLVEKAVGVDTTARVQTVWQVKVLPNVGNGATCGGTIQAWNDLIAPSAGRLSTDAKGVPSQTDPCLIPPTGGYLGLENQLYRVEIHDGGPVGTATFKWSRENASVATNVNGIVSTTELQVDSLGRDSVLCFAAGDWIEITDDARELAGLPGIIRKVVSVAPDTKIIKISKPLAAGEPDLNQHARIRRWDHSGQVIDANNQSFFDLDASASAGVIPVPPAGRALRLENGVEVTFSVNPTGGPFHAGDYWVFAARAADASVEKLDKAAPRGIHHHFGRLAIVTFPGPVSDCRVLWPPEECCDCTVCVTPESHNGRSLTIQQAVDKIKNTGGTVCLAPGLYNISANNPVTIAGASSIRLKGQSWSTILVSDGAVPGITISDSARITVEDLTLAMTAKGKPALNVFGIRNCAAVTVQRCAIALLAGQKNQTALALGGFVIETRIRDNVIYGANGISRLVSPSSPQVETAGDATAETARAIVSNLTALLRIDDNFIFATGNGISLDRTFLHLAENRVAGNFITGCDLVGIEALGKVFAEFSGSRLDLHGNVIRTALHGIAICTGETRITDNDIGPDSGLDQSEVPRTSADGAGILLTGEPGRIEHCQILENRVHGIGGVGIGIQASIVSAMIKQNIIDGTGRGGIVMTNEAFAEELTVENNQAFNIGGGSSAAASAPRAGIRVVNAQQTTIAGNTIVGVGLVAVSPATAIAAISVASSVSIRIAGNTLLDIAPPGNFSGTAAGIEIIGAFRQLDVTDNEVKRNRGATSTSGPKWRALLIDETGPNPFGNNAVVTVWQASAFNGQANGHAATRGPQTVAVHGNVFEGAGAIALLVVKTKGTCLFNDNRCIFTDLAGPAAPGNPVAQINAGAVVLNANYFTNTKSNPPQFAVALVSQPAWFTVVGNIVRGKISVNNSPLVAPWLPLNIYNL
jgi:hypothetical protein